MAAEEQSLAITAPPPVVLHHFKIIDVQKCGDLLQGTGILLVFFLQRIEEETDS